MQKELKDIEKQTAELLGELGLTKAQQKQVMRVVTTKLVKEYHSNITRGKK